MADLILTSKQLILLHPVLAAVEKLSPPPTAKGRYALAKAAAKAGPAFDLYADQERKLLLRCAVKNEDGSVKVKDLGNGQAHFDWLPELAEEATKEMAALQAEEVVLSGVRMVTHAELGACPITGEQERILMAVGLLDDIEPA